MFPHQIYLPSHIQKLPQTQSHILNPATVTMVRLEEVEDEAFIEKPSTTKDGALLDDDDDYTDTGQPLSPFSLI
jgi:hypothetical protein